MTVMIGSRGPRIAALVKQIPAFERMELGSDGRLVRDGVALEMNAYCRRAVAKGVELARESGGTCTVFTLGPPAAEDVLREAIAWGADAGVLITDPAFVGSDTLATARALAVALDREGPFDLILLGRNSVDADTGQVPPQVAELLDLPFATGVRQLELESSGGVRVRCEHDDEWVDLRMDLPAVLSTAERLCDPCKSPSEARAAVPVERIRRLVAADLGPGPWGQDGSPTTVGEVRVLPVERLGRRLDGPVAEQVDEAIRLLIERRALSTEATRTSPPVPSWPQEPAICGHVGPGTAVGVLVEPGRERLVRELLGAAATIAQAIGGRVVALGYAPGGALELASWGADAVIEMSGSDIEEDLAGAVIGWAREVQPWAILAPGTAWGREVASRTAAALGVGLTGDAVALEVKDQRLLCWKPAFGGQTVAAIGCRSPIQMATVHPGVLELLDPRPVSGGGAPVSIRRVEPRGRVRVEAREREDDSEVMVLAPVVIGVGQGVDATRYPELEDFRRLLGAELGATRKVTDQGWLPRARQIGITGHSIAPRLFISLGSSGKFNHIVGVRQAGTVLSINPDPDAPIWGCSDIGITARWEDAVPLLEYRLADALLQQPEEAPHG